MTKQDQKFIVFSLTDEALYCAFVNEDLETFATIIRKGKGKSISKNEFITRDEAENFGGLLAYSGNGIPLFAYDPDNTPYIEIIKKLNHPQLDRLH